MIEIDLYLFLIIVNKNMKNNPILIWKGYFYMKKLIVIILLAVIVILSNKNEETVMIPSSSIRMRVIANSNSKADQEEKIIVKSKLEEIISNMISSHETIDEVDNDITLNKDNIDNKLIEEMKDNNITVSYNSNYGENYFPEKEFKGVIYPSGNYKSFVVTLGEGKGENWWCVMYPPLCLIDEKDEYTYRSLIKDTIDKYN